MVYRHGVTLPLAEEYSLLGGNAMYLGRSPPVFQTNVFLPCLGSKIKANKKPARSKWQDGLLFNPEDRHSTFLFKHPWNSFP
jgi:hypothetical protein